MTNHADLEFEIALALREVRLYWRPHRNALSLDDKRRLAALILDRVGRERIRVEARPEPPQGQGTGRFMGDFKRPGGEE